MKKVWLIISIILLFAIGIYFLNSSLSGNAILKSNSKFCGRSSFAYCTSSEQCIPSGCGNQLCGGKSEAKPVSRFCKTKSCYDAEKYNLECTCYKSLCQWKNKTLSS